MVLMRQMGPVRHPAGGGAAEQASAPVDWARWCPGIGPDYDDLIDPVTGDLELYCLAVSERHGRANRNTVGTRVRRSGRRDRRAQGGDPHGW